MKALEIDDALGDLGTSITANAGQEAATLAFEVLKRNLARTLPIVAKVAMQPSFPAEEVERERKIRLDELAQEGSDPRYISARVSQMVAFGRNHPYGRTSAGYPSTITPLTREDFVKFHDTYWKPGGSALVFVGDISLSEATALAKQSFGEWKGAAPAAITIPEPQPIKPGKVFLVNRPDAAQTQVSEILPGPTRKSADFYALDLANTVWGGAAGARLGMNLREEKGYSYGVFSFPIPHDKYGMWRASGGVQTNKTKEAVVEFEKELKAIAGAKPISETELADAKHNRVRGYAQQFESMDEVAGQVEDLWIFGLPTTELQREPEELEKTSSASANAAAQKYAKGGGALVLVGDLSKIEAGIRELNLGEVVILDAEGKPAAKK